MDSPLTVVALKSDLHATGNDVVAERDRLLEDLNRYKIESEPLKKLILEKGAARKAMSTCLKDLNMIVSTNRNRKINFWQNIMLNYFLLQN